MNGPGPAFCVLASGSAGNCTAVVLGSDCARSVDDEASRGERRRRVLLVDLGLSPRATRRRLHDAGCAWLEVTDVLLTHLDSDHFNPSWIIALHHAEVRVHASAPHAEALLAMGVAPARIRPMACRDRRSRSVATTALGVDTVARAVPLPHDDGFTIGWVIEHAGVRIGLATDLGTVPRALLEAFVDLDALLIESNYDPAMQHASPRPEFLKRRIMGGRGHLSNEQALEAILAIERRSQLQTVTLLHLSRQCNDPRLVKALYAARAPHLLERLLLSSQDMVTPVVRVARSERMAATLWG